MSDENDTTAIARTEAETVAALAYASAGGESVEAGSVTARTVPKGYRLDLVDAEHLLAEPRRTRGEIHLYDAASLVRYCDSAESTRARLYADAAIRTIACILNDDCADGTPGWRDHRVNIELRQTRAWREWCLRDGVLSNQRDYADWLEDRMGEIVAPDAAELLEMVSAIQGMQSARFGSRIRRKDGTRTVHWDETVEASAGGGELQVPDHILVRVAPFEGSAAVEVQARTRLRINGGDLLIGFVLDRPREVEEEAFRAEIKVIEEGTGLVALQGKAPAPTGEERR